MTEPKPSTSRRDFLKTTGVVAGASALSQVAIPAVHAAEDNTIRVALVGCGVLLAAACTSSGGGRVASEAPFRRFVDAWTAGGPALARTAR